MAKSSWMIIALSLTVVISTTGVVALDFNYTSTGATKPCVHVILDAILTLNLHNEAQTRTLSLTKAYVSSGTCKADKTELNVALQQSHSVHFLFSKDASGNVSSSFKVEYSRQGTTNLILESEPSVIFGAGEVYQCKSQDTVLLHDDSGKYVGTLFISNLTFHAFDSQNGTSSEKVKTCSIDNTNSTLQPLNRTPKEDLTDDIADFVLRNENGTSCVRLSGEIDLLYQYEKSNGNFTTVKLTVPKTAIVSGFCDVKRSYLVLRYTEGGANRGVAFYLSHVGTSTVLDSIETIVKLDSAKFPNAKFANVLVRSYGRFGEQMGSGNSYYGCQHEKQFVGSDFILETRHLQLQTSMAGAEWDFSPERTSCPEDDVKMTATQVFSLKDGNQTCLLLSGAFRFTIPYTSRQNKTEDQVVNVPFSSKINVSGDCNSTKHQELTLSFYNSWRIRFKFESTSKSASDKSILGYKMDNVTATYEENPLIFYNMNRTSKNRPFTVFSESFGSPLKATATGYYQCDGTMEMTLGEVTLEVMNLRFQAFHKSTSGEFSGEVSTCNALSKTQHHTTTFVIVGLVIVAIVVLVIVVVIFSMKKRKQTSYQQMD